MGTSPPAYVFVIRHGSRLDQADKNWHLSSATPYDTPLTYNGWLQAQATGSSIASILRQAERDSDSVTSSPSSKPPGVKKKKKKFNIVIHTSPFLRCVQTSVGISAGLSQPPPPSPTPSPGPEGQARGPSSSPSPTRSPTAAASANNGIQRIPLRVDAFLGEWLNPEYFESITRPPSSDRLISAAKVGLLRKETISAYETSARPAAGASASQAHTHGRLWSSPKLNPEPAPERTGSVDSLSLGLDGMPAMASALPRERAGSSGSVSSFKTGTGATTPPIEGYIPPTPNYAISSSDKIPDGYVAHARDACSAVDYQWDSVKQWGNGGEFGEEWITMHRRFRKGFQHLIDWYAATEDPTKLVTQNAQATHKGKAATNEEEIETVVIVVSHGAGCNAMIGAITRQPVLMDVGVATITMAARKPDMESTAADASANSAEVSIDQCYDLKMQASNAHLRGLAAGGSALARAASLSSHSGYTPPVHPRGRVSTMASYNPPSGGIFGDLGNPVTRSNSAAAQTGYSGRKTSHVASSLSKETPLVDTSKAVASSGLARRGTGLWEPSPVQRKDDDDDDMFPDFDGTRRFGKPVDAAPASAPEAAAVPKPAAVPLSTSPDPVSDDNQFPVFERAEKNPVEDANPRQGTASGGLWGSGG